MESTQQSLTGRELDRAIATAMYHAGGEGYLPYGTDEDGAHYQRIPAFHESLDALRDGPEKVLREAGCLVSVYYFPDHVQAEWRIPRKGGGAPNIYDGQGLTEALARADAALKALTALQEVNRG